MKIGITGIDGLIGWHLRTYLHSRGGLAVCGADKAEFASQDALENFVSSCDVIVHLAGMNRGPDAEVASTNVALTEQLLAACDAAGASPHLIFSSSTHIFRGTPYGESKKKCAAVMRSWADAHKVPFTNFILPNVFGESGKPFYNSAVSTFCYQLANGEKTEIIKDIEVELLHARHVARAVWDAIEKRVNGEIVLHGYKITVSALLARLKGMDEQYSSHVVPALGQEIDLDLFNTYRSYLYPSKVPVALDLKSDPRGYLFEAAKSPNGGQTFISSTKPGITRGNHYHIHKFERFLVLQGKACIKVRKLFSSEAHSFHVSGEKPEYVDMPALHTHNITNIGDTPLLTLFWSSEIFDPAAPDTYQETV